MDRTYTSVPEGTNDATPIVVLAMHLFGVDRSSRDAADRFAAHGYACIVPDLYRDMNAPDGDGSNDAPAFIPLARSLDSTVVGERFHEALARMRERFPRGKAVIAGFCMGGVMATYRANRARGGFDAVAAWYGLSNDIAPSDVDLPIVASYGGADAGIPVDRIEAFRAGLGTPNDIHVYPGAQHAFCDATRAAYDADACEDSWRRAFAFLERNL